MSPIQVLSTREDSKWNEFGAKIQSHLRLWDLWTCMDKHMRHNTRSNELPKVSDLCSSTQMGKGDFSLDKKVLIIIELIIILNLRLKFILAIKQLSDCGSPDWIILFYNEWNFDMKIFRKHIMLYSIFVHKG